MIAISYRRDDSLPVAGRLYDRLQAEFGRGNVFMDFDSIPYGVDFRDHIKQIIGRAKVLVAIIGPNWMGQGKHQGRRIDEPNDFVRLEIGYALECKLPIIPILVSHTEMPRSEELPKDIEALAFRNGLRLDVGIDFHHHAERLSTAISRILAEGEPPKSAEPEKHSAQTAVASEAPVVATEPRPETVTPQPTPVRQKPAVAKSKAAPVTSEQDVRVVEEKSAKPAAIPSAQVQARRRRRFIGLQTLISAIRATFAKLGRSFGDAVSTIKSGTRRLCNWIGNSTRTFLRNVGESLRRRRKAIALAAISMAAVAIVAGAIYWGVRSGTFQLLLSQTTEWFRSEGTAKIQPPQPSARIVPRASENPVATVPIVPATPAPMLGAVMIDSTPQGGAYELIDSNNKHYIGKTPGTVEDLPGGYAQIIFKREGFTDHSEAIWISPGERPSITWNFPENDRLKPVAKVEPSPTIAPVIAAAPITPSSPTAAPSVSPAAQSVQPWQERISDFVKQFVAVNQLQDANATVGFYSPSVDYFGSRGKDHAFILRDIQKYNTLWPARRDIVDGDIHVEEKVPDQQYRANYNVILYAENPKTTDWTRGQIAATLDVNIIDGLPKIVAINQKKLQRPQSGKGKGPRPPDMEPPGPISPTKLIKVVVTKYGFSALLPPELFPDAAAKLADGTTDDLTSLKGCATVVFSAPHGNVRNVYDNYVKQFEAAPEHRTIDYKVVKDTWFVVSGSTKTTGYYVKGVRHGEDIFVMDLNYVGAVCRIPASMVAQMSHAFNGNTEPVLTKTDVSSEGTAAAEPIPQKLISVRIKKYGVSVALPPEVFPDADKLNRDDETFLQGKSWSGRTTLRFFSAEQTLNKTYADLVAKHPADYKVLKPTWFAVSGDLGIVEGTYMGFYIKGIKKGNQVILMDFEYQDDDFPFNDETFGSIVRSFVPN
jgi:hypothetical protein